MRQTHKYAQKKPNMDHAQVKSKYSTCKHSIFPFAVSQEELRYISGLLNIKNHYCLELNWEYTEKNADNNKLLNKQKIPSDTVSKTFQQNPSSVNTKKNNLQK